MFRLYCMYYFTLCTLRIVDLQLSCFSIVALNVVYEISQVSYILQTKGNFSFCMISDREMLHSICKIWDLWIRLYVYHVSCGWHGDGLNFRVVLLELVIISVAGPVIHWDSNNSLAFIPREASSAGFCFRFNMLPPVNGGILLNLLHPVNTWNCLLSLLMYPRTMLLSVQKYSTSIWYSSSRRSWLLIVWSYWDFMKVSLIM